MTTSRPETWLAVRFAVAVQVVPARVVDTGADIATAASSPGQDAAGGTAPERYAASLATPGVGGEGDDEERGRALTAAQAVVLDRLAQQGSAAVSDVAAAEGMRPQAVAPVIGALDRRGLVERRPDPDDPRRHLVSLTAAGRSVHEDSRQGAGQQDAPGKPKNGPVPVTRGCGGLTAGLVGYGWWVRLVREATPPPRAAGARRGRIWV